MTKTIMIIEDEPDIRFTLQEFLEFEGYKVQVAGNGLEAMGLLETTTPPNLILLDMKMPVMNGWEFAGEFLKKHNHSSPIVVITAAADAEKRAKDINAAGWVSKPFDLDILLKRIKQLET